MSQRVLAPLRFFSFWSINTSLDGLRLQHQLDHMKQLGFDGVVFHPRFYPNDPSYLSPAFLRVVSQLILHARQIGLVFWLYDENGWPSGVADGQVTRENPQWGSHWLALTREKPSDHAPLLTLPATDETPALHVSLQRTTTAIDYLNPQPCERFLQLTLDAYRTGLDPAAWEYVEAIFTDEPEFGLGHAYDRLPPQGAIPWTPALPELYRQRTGRDVWRDLPSIIQSREDSAEVRVKFWEFLTDLHIEGFFTPYRRWCDAHGKIFTGHLKGEEHPLFQVMMHGSAHRVLGQLHQPGIDSLERFPSNDYFPRVVSSIAQQFGDGRNRSMVECMAGGGWGFSPQDMQQYVRWLSGHGLNDFVVHLWQARLNSDAIRDWPPSIANHLNWSEAYPSLLETMRHEREAQERSNRRNPDTLLVSPHRAIMAAIEPWELMQTNVHSAWRYPDTRAGRINHAFMQRVAEMHTRGLNYHCADERTIESDGCITEHGLQIGRMTYRHVVIDAGCHWTSTGRQIIEQARARGLLETSPRDGADVARSMATKISADDSVLVEPTGVVMRDPTALELRRDNNAATPAEHAPILEVKWQVEPRCNDWLLEVAAVRRADFTVNFAGVTDQPLTLRTADILDAASINGHQLEVQIEDEGSCAKIEPHQLQNTADNQLVLRFAAPVHQPMIWLTGAFELHSESPWRAGSIRTVFTEGPWRMSPSRAKTSQTIDGIRFAEDWVQRGYPFARATLIQRARVRLLKPLPANARMQLPSVKADAARLRIDGRDLGWCWGPNWSVTLPEPVDAGEHEFELHLVPSTFNHFGPHHHHAGDPPLTSPMQFTGQKCFADDPDAPDFTLVTGWHFRPLVGPRTLCITS